MLARDDSDASAASFRFALLCIGVLAPAPYPACLLIRIWQARAAGERSSAVRVLASGCHFIFVFVIC